MERTLTARQIQVQALAAAGYPQADIARLLGISRERVRQIAGRLRILADQYVPSIVTQSSEEVAKP